MQIIFPPRPKGKIHPDNLNQFESTGLYIAQKKFQGSRALIHIGKNGQVLIANRHGRPFSKFKPNITEEVLSLNLSQGKEYWLDGEFMSDKRLILFDILQAGKFFFNGPDQLERLSILDEICRKPQKIAKGNLALHVTENIQMAVTYFNNFDHVYRECLPIRQLEGLVLRKKHAKINNFGFCEYETNDLIRCRKSYMCESPKKGRSGGYDF